MPTFVSMSTITSISAYCGINLGGAKTIAYAPTHWIDADSYDPVFLSGNLQYDLDFDEGDWLDMPYLGESVTWTEQQERGEHGPYYAHSINFTIKQMRVEVQQVLEAMAHVRFVVKYTDRNNKVWLIGTPEFGLNFESDGVGAGADGGLNSYRCRFFGQTPRRAVGYVPVS